MPDITLEGKSLGIVNSFCYDWQESWPTDWANRIGKAAKNFGLLEKCAWNNRKLLTAVKMSIYESTCVLSEMWATCGRHSRRLNSFHIRCLHKILEVKWKDKIPNTEVLECAGLTHLETTIKKRGCDGLVMTEEWEETVSQRIFFKVSFEMALESGCLLWWSPQNMCKNYMKSFNINIKRWEKWAESYRIHLAVGAAHHEATLTQRMKAKWERRKCAVILDSNSDNAWIWNL